MNRRWGLGPKVAGATAGFGEQHESVVELVETAAVLELLRAARG
jgi:hypothetical protein